MSCSRSLEDVIEALKDHLDRLPAEEVRSLSIVSWSVKLSTRSISPRFGSTRMVQIDGFLYARGFDSRRWQGLLRGCVADTSKALSDLECEDLDAAPVL